MPTDTTPRTFLCRPTQCLIASAISFFSLFIFPSAPGHGLLIADEDIRIESRANPGAIGALGPEAPPPDITRGDLSRMRLSITFDGGSESAEAEAILDTLAARGIKTTIFLTGLFIERHPETVRRIAREGHEVGNHTMTHPHLTEYAASRRQKKLPWVDRAYIVRELKEAEALFRGATGSEMVPLWRAPYGEVNDEIRLWAHEAGYRHVGWTSDWKTKESLDSLDWVSNRRSRLYRTPREIKEKILNFNRETHGVRGGIILMHLSTERKTDRVSASLGDILDSLIDKGYKFVKVSELIDGAPFLDAARMQGQRAPKDPA